MSAENTKGIEITEKEIKEDIKQALKSYSFEELSEIDAFVNKHMKSSKK